MSNHLANQSSPYLLQHASNPVDWYPWGEEAFEKARKEDKPVFLSIGYSTCHWCHVMARESFESEETARILNRYFVSVKVDREERPDIDSVYMSVCQALSGSGGWPMSIFMTAGQKPFFAGTYFPPVSRHGMTGFGNCFLRLQKNGRMIGEGCFRQRKALWRRSAQARIIERNPSTPVRQGKGLMKVCLNGQLKYFQGALMRGMADSGRRPSFLCRTIFFF